MSNNVLLESFIEPLAPTTISYFPITIGWQILLFLLVVLIVYKLVIFLIQYRANAYRREALRDINNLEGFLAKNKLNTSLLIDLNSTLKRAAIKAYPQHNIGGLHANAWLAFLSNTSDYIDFSAEHFQMWQTLIYQPQQELEFVFNHAEYTTLIHSVKAWLLDHKGETA